ncbi:MAG: LysR family transcriptional regulator [Dysosmobacter sp.]|nr:LysR family transcriptional regulator [Dysosmobacter sp.]
MDIKYFEYFDAVARCGSINKAAQALYISQPHLSHIIRDIESEVGMELLRRTKQGVTLTPEGEKFLEHARAILREMESLKNFTRQSPPEKDRLSVSMTKFTHTMEVFNEICAENQRQERFSYRLNEGTAVDVIEDVAAGVTDVGVLDFTSSERTRFLARLGENGLEFRHVATLMPHIVVSKNHELLRQGRPVTLENLRDYAFVRYSGQYEDFIYSISTEDARMDMDNSPRIIYVDGRSALMNLIAVSECYTIGIQAFSAQDSMYQCVSVPIPNCTERLEFGIVTRRDAALSQPERRFVDRVAACYQALQRVE